MELRRLAPANRLQSFGYAVCGIWDVFRTQPNTWIMALAAVVVVVGGWLFQVGWIEWALLAAAVFVVIVAETLNTAIEYVTDLASPECHPLAKRAKDAAAGAVLLAVVFALIVAALVFGPRICAWGRPA